MGIEIQDDIVYQSADDGAGGTIYERRDNKQRHTYKIVGSGTAADDTEFATLVSHVNTHGGVIEIAGDLVITSLHYLTGAYGIRGLSGSSISFAEDGWIYVNSYKDFVAESGITINDMAQRSNLVEGAGLTVLSQGDYVWVASDQEITEDYVRHADAMEHRPLEIHRIQKMVRGGDGTKWVLDNYVHDEIETASPRLYRITDMMEGFFVENLIIKSDSTTVASKHSFTFSRIANLRITNLINRSPAAGEISLQGCYDVRMQGCCLEEKVNPDAAVEDWVTGYGITVGPCNGVIIEDCDFGFLRHAITTTSAPGSGSHRYGDVRGMTVKNCQCRQGLTIQADLVSGTSGSLLDTHSEGIGVQFVNNTIWIPDSSSLAGSWGMVGFTNRSRETVFRGNTIKSDISTPNKGLVNNGPNVIIENNHFEGGWKPLSVEDNASIGASFQSQDNAMIRGNRFLRCEGPGVWLSNGSNHVVTDNYFDSGYVDSFREHIRIQDGSGHKITGNNLSKKNNLLVLTMSGSVTKTDIAEFADNDCWGYGTDVLGFDRGVQDGIDLDTQWLGANVAAKSSGPVSVFSSVASMVAYGELFDGSQYSTTGYYSADGGKNDYVYHSTGRSGETMDGGFYVTGAGADDYFEAVDKSVANVLQFGARGDGTTDDTAAIQAAIDVGSSGKPVLVPDGTYLITSDVSAGAILRISGTGTFKLQDAMLEATAAADLSIEGITFDGDDQTVKVIEAGGILSANIRLTGITVMDVFGNADTVAAILIDDADRIVVSNSVFKDITCIGNGTIGDAIGACRALQLNGECPSISVTNCSFANVNNVTALGGRILFEDADAIACQPTNNKLQQGSLTGCSFTNVGKRALKLQLDVGSKWSVSDCVVDSAWMSASVTNVNTGDGTITASGHNIINDDRVEIWSTSGSMPTGLSTSTLYYAVGVSGTTLQLSLTSGGAAVVPSTAGSDVRLSRDTGMAAAFDCQAGPANSYTDGGDMTVSNVVSQGGAINDIVSSSADDSSLLISNVLCNHESRHWNSAAASSSVRVSGDSSFVAIANSKLKGGRFGIYITETSTVSVSNVDIYGMTIGISFLSNQDNVVRLNGSRIIHDTHWTQSSRYGILAGNQIVSELSVIGCQFEGFRDGVNKAADTGSGYRVILVGNSFDVVPNAAIVNSDTDGWQYWTTQGNVFSTGGGTYDTTANRPASLGTKVGFMYFDTTLGHPIWWDGTNWIDSAGTTV